MKFELDRRNTLIVVETIIIHKERELVTQFMVDTGSEITTIRSSLLPALQINSADYTRKLDIRGVGKTVGYQYEVDQFAALDHRLRKLRLITTDLNPAFPFSGIIGLDFLKLTRKRLVIDFQLKEIELL